MGQGEVTSQLNVFEKLQLTIAYQPEDQALEVEITLYQDAWDESECQPHLRGLFGF
jgi:hypothetical protein